MSTILEIEMNDGTVIKGSIIARALNVMVVHTITGEFLLISKFAMKDPKKFKMGE